MVRVVKTQYARKAEKRKRAKVAAAVAARAIFTILRNSLHLRNIRISYTNYKKCMKIFCSSLFSYRFFIFVNASTDFRLIIQIFYF